MMSVYKMGWGRADITPQGGPVSLEGQFATRITDKVADPLLAVCLYVESEGVTSIWVSVDSAHICKSLSTEVESLLSEKMEGYKAGMLMMSATHIHTGPYHERGGWLSLTGHTSDDPGTLTAEECRGQIARGVVDAVLRAKANLRDTELELAVAPVITGVNRRVVYADNSAMMYGELNGDDFYRMEARDGGPTQLLYAYTVPEHKLTGVVVNVPCTAQCDENASYITADYFAIVRKRIAADWGEDVAILPLIRSAGDLSPHPMVDRIAGEEDYQSGRLCAERMGGWIADVIEMFKSRTLRKLPGKVHKHISRDFELPLWNMSEAEYQAAKDYLANDAHYRLDGTPVSAFDHANAWSRVHRMEMNETNVRTRVNATRLDDVALISMPFEVFIAYGDRIRMRVPQAIVFDIELAYDKLGYLATREAVCGGGYSANIFNGVCDPSGGDRFVETCAGIIQSLF